MATSAVRAGSVPTTMDRIGRAPLSREYFPSPSAVPSLIAIDMHADAAISLSGTPVSRSLFFFLPGERSATKGKEKRGGRDGMEYTP